MSKKMRMLQILNLWRLIPAYLIVCVSDNKAIIFEEIQHWKKCTRRTEKSGFDIFSSLMLVRDYSYNMDSQQILVRSESEVIAGLTSRLRLDIRLIRNHL